MQFGTLEFAMGQVRIRILDDNFDAQSEDSLLRTLQLYCAARQLPPYGFARFCWNGSCKQCWLDLECNGATDRAMACQTDVCEGQELKSVPSVLMWSRKPATKP